MIHFLVFILVYPLIILISILPFRLMYLFSDFLFLIVYYIVGYRKKTVYENLKIAFPNMEENEILQLRKKFYHHFIDMFLEMIKTFTISNEEIAKRFHMTNKDAFIDYLDKHKNLVLLSSHYANYEWIFGLNQFVTFPTYAAYKKVKNKYFDSFVKKSRGRFNSNLITTRNYMKTVEENNKNGTYGLYGLLSDQSPKLKSVVHYTTFFGKEVPAFVGGEKIAKKYNYPVVFLKTKKLKRGYYQTEFEVICENPRAYPDFEITDLFIQKLEAQIKEDPHCYFWTHKRFKHMKNN